MFSANFLTSEKFCAAILLVLAEGHVDRPVELVLDLPVVADVGVEGASDGQAADVEAAIGGLFAVDCIRLRQMDK